MWIMLTEKLPITDSPPKLSIFWSTPWPDEKFAPVQSKAVSYARRIRDRNEGGREWTSQEEYETRRELAKSSHMSLVHSGSSHMTEDDDSFLEEPFGMQEPNWIKARQILYKGQAIRVFPHEYTTPKRENLLDYIRESHTLVPEGAASERLVQGTLDTDAKFVYDAALVDGADPAQAMLTALGMDITMPDDEIPQVGWYKVKPEYGLFYCEPWELNITDDEAQFIIDNREII